MRTIKRFLSLASSDRVLILQALFWVALVRSGLGLLRLQTLQRALHRFTGKRGAPNAVPAVEPERIAWAVSSVSRYVPATACLAQALAAQVLLARNGYPSNLKIGVALGEQNRLHAHAWVEIQNRVLIGGGAILEQLTPLANFDS